MTELEAVNLFTKKFGGSYQKVSQSEPIYKILDSTGALISYAYIAIRIRSMNLAYPLSIQAKNITKILDKRLLPTVIWACEDGIIYGLVEKIRGEIFYSPNDLELMCYYDKQRSFKYVRVI